MTPAVWAVVPAAGRGRRFGGPVPKQYLDVGGQPVLAHALDALLVHDGVCGVMVAIAPDDADWPGWTQRCGKPVHTCRGGAERADSVRAALEALDGLAPPDAWVLVHDAARPNLARADLDRLLAAAFAHGHGAILAAPVRDTLKRAVRDDTVAATQPREGMWRAFTPQLFRRDALAAALDAARAAGVMVTDESMAMERAGARVQLVEGREDNLKVTTPADLALVEFLIARRAGEAACEPDTGASA